MKTSEIVLSLVAATFAGIAVVTWNGEAEAVERADKAQAALNAANVRNAQLTKADGEHRARIADLEKSLKAAAAEAADVKTQLSAAVEAMKAAKKDLEVGLCLLTAFDGVTEFGSVAQSGEFGRERVHLGGGVGARLLQLRGLRDRLGEGVLGVLGGRLGGLEVLLGGLHGLDRGAELRLHVGG
ncbi:MAG: hypothetical protein ACKOLZ_09280, partial [Verrucomicrobiota bacterium]